MPIDVRGIENAEMPVASVNIINLQLIRTWAFTHLITQCLLNYFSADSISRFQIKCTLYLCKQMTSCHFGLGTFPLSPDLSLVFHSLVSITAAQQGTQKCVFLGQWQYATMLQTNRHHGKV